MTLTTGLDLNHVSSTSLSNAVNSTSTSTLKIDAKLYKLNPLHVAVMNRDVPELESLLEKRVYDVNQTDVRQWTPLHHAAATLQHPAIALLKKYGANPNLTNDRNGTPQDLMDLVTLPKPETSVPVLMWDEELKKLDEKPGTEVSKRLGATFAHEVYTPEEVLLKDWASLKGQKKSSAGNKINETLRARYEEFRKQPPALYLSNQQTNDKGESIQNIGYGVFANRDFQPGELVCEYIGEDTTDQPSNENVEYKLGEIDGGTKHRIVGFGSLIQTSFPNCITTPIDNAKGRNRRILLVATEAIKKNDHITFDYGPAHPVYKQFYELRPTALINFFSGQKFETALKCFEAFTAKLKSDPSLENLYFHFMDDLDSADKVAKTLYLDNNLSALAYLFFNRLVTFKNIKVLFSLPVKDVQNMRDKKDLILKELKLFSALPADFQRYFAEIFNPFFIGSSQNFLYSVIRNLSAFQGMPDFAALAHGNDQIVKVSMEFTIKSFFLDLMKQFIKSAGFKQMNEFKRKWFITKSLTFEKEISPKN